MEFLGIGPAELLLILVIALIVVGPERLPEISRTIARTLNNLRAMSQTLTSEWQQELTAVNDLKTGAQELQQSLTEPFKAAQTDLQHTFTEPLKEAQTDVQRAFSEPLTSPSSATADAPSPNTAVESSSPATVEPAGAATVEHFSAPIMLPLDGPSAANDPTPQPVEIPDTSNNHTGQAND